MGDSSSTQSTKTGQMSPEGKSYLSAVMSYAETQADIAGYQTVKEQVTEYQDKSRATSLQTQIDNTKKEIADLQADLKNNPPKISKMGGTATRNDPREQRILQLNSTLYRAEGELAGLPQDTYEKISVKKKPDPRVQDAIDKFGADSQQAKAAEAQVKQEEVSMASDKAEANVAFYKNLAKYVNGDLSYTAEQAAQVDAYWSPIRDVINKTVNDLTSKYADDEQMLISRANDISKQIDETGFDTMSALEAAGVQMETNAKDMLTVLKEANESTANKFKFQQDLLFQQIDKDVSQQAAMLGLPPGSPAENFQKAKMKQDVFTQLQLQLAEQESQGKVAVQQELNAGKKQISLSKVALAASQGEKKEGVSRQILSIAGDSAAKQEQALGLAGQQLLEAEKGKQSMLYNTAFGGIPSMIGVGAQGLGFDTAQKDAQMNMAANAAAPYNALQNQEYNRTMAETTTTKTESPSFLDTFTGLVGGAAGAAGSVMSGVGALSPEK